MKALLFAFLMLLLPSPVFAEIIPQALAKETLTFAQDTAITTYIYAKLASNSQLSSANIDVSTSDGKVALSGILNDESQVRTLIHLATSISGVKNVDTSQIITSQQENRLYIKPMVMATTPTTIIITPEHSTTQKPIHIAHIKVKKLIRQAQHHHHHHHHHKKLQAMRHFSKKLT